MARYFFGAGNVREPIGKDARRRQRDTRILKGLEPMLWKRKFFNGNKRYISLAADDKWLSSEDASRN